MKNLKNKKEEYLNGQNSEFLDILKYNPNWLIRWGVTIIAAMVLVLIIISGYINEPEIIRCSYSLYVQNSPVIHTKDTNIVSNIYKCKIYIGISDKSKIKTGKNLTVELSAINSDKPLQVTCGIDSIKFNPDKEMYELTALISSGLTGAIKNEINDKGIAEGNGKIIIENISLFNRIFYKYNSFK